MSSRFDPTSPMGTRGWWDYQIAHNWEQNGGPAQTRSFMKALIDHLPSPEQTYLRANSLSILDCGCAMGEGVDILSQAFPLCCVAGLDIAQSAIDAAQAGYPQHEFILSEEGEIPRPFDVVLTSNVLEHLNDPWAMARRQAVNSRLLYLILVPYLEYPLIDGHLITFTEYSFPDYLGGLARLSVTPFEISQEVWYGKQILAVYASQAYLHLRRLEGDAQRLERAQDWKAYFGSPPEWRALVEDLAIRCARAETALKLAELATMQELFSQTSASASAGRPVSQKNWYLLVENLKRLERLRERWAPPGTWRRVWLNRFVGWVLSKHGSGPTFGRHHRPATASSQTDNES
jgi:SAM-dependent methyltransferase